MKLRFNSFDIICGVKELQGLIGYRVNQIYDVDNKTYLIRLQGGRDAKQILLIESGIRFHTTVFEWPKNMAPSGFSMKLRKHLKNKRLEKVQQLGVDRIVDFQFGIGELSNHIILELYDRGNIVLTDHEMTILYILRSYQDGEDVRFAIREKYPVDRAKIESSFPNEDELRNILKSRNGDSLKRVIMSIMDCGPTVIEHALLKHKLDSCVIPKCSILDGNDAKGNVNHTVVENSGKKLKIRKNLRDQANAINTREFDAEKDIKSLAEALKDISNIMTIARMNVSKGYIIQRKEEKPGLVEGKEIDYYYRNVEYNPYKFCQYEGEPVAEFESFMLAVDEYYSTLESQKIDMKTLQQEREAFKKLSNVKKDHIKRIEDLSKAQECDKQRAELITMNQSLVDNAILAIRSAVANQMSWSDIRELVKAAQASGDHVAVAIKQLKLETNHISLNLSDLYGTVVETKAGSQENKENNVVSMLVDVDLGLSAWANARKYYDRKRSAAQKEKKTFDASQKALKSAERKTLQTLKDVRTISTISKARKVFWFEKFYWFISSENFLVIGGRDAQQNELIVKRYMRVNDIYVHAEIQGASSVVVRNPNSGDIPPKTLLEAGTMAISYSVAWDAKVVSNAYWVHSHQVSKTAPTGEYLSTGSFMIRGKKNFLPPCHLVMGLSILFKLKDNSIEAHRGERKVKIFEGEQKQAESLLEIDFTENVHNVTEIEFEEKGSNEESNDKEYSVTKERVDNKVFKNKNYKTKEDNFATDPISIEFPDTQVKVEHDIGRITFVNQPKVFNNDDNQSNILFEEESTIITAAPSRKKHQQSSKKRKEEKEKIRKEQLKQQCEIENSKNANNMHTIKRGQKGKLKKIKSKYRDQDDEERQMRMQILKSAGKSVQNVSDPKLEEVNSAINNSSIKQPVDKKYVRHEDVIDIDEASTNFDLEVIDSLTGQPLQQDELLFAVPVVAPYQALQSYKFKVKLTPGVGKRGRAAKIALAMFTKDKMCTPREKDLLKSIREEALARNIPGKVKLSAPQLQKFTK